VTHLLPQQFPQQDDPGSHVQPQFGQSQQQDSAFMVVPSEKRGTAQYEPLASASVIAVGERLDDRALVIGVAALARVCQSGQSLTNRGEVPDASIDLLDLPPR
jgi:hypothetical protein